MFLKKCPPSYVFNEISLGEDLQEKTDLSWRLLEVFVWIGFTLGLTGYLRLYLQVRGPPKRVSSICEQQQVTGTIFFSSFVPCSPTAARSFNNRTEE